MVATVYAVKELTNGTTIENIVTGGYEESSIEFDKPPEFDFTVSSLSGIELETLKNGRDINIQRGDLEGGEVVMPGIVETPEGEEGDSRSATVRVSGIHRGYAMIRAGQCTSYDFDEDGLAQTTRDAVTVNNWRYSIWRLPDGPLNIFGKTRGVDGVVFDDVVKCIAGTRFVAQLDFQDNTYLLPSQIFATTNAVQVYRDGQTGDKRPALQRVRSGAGFKAGASIESIPLLNNDRNVQQMGTVKTVTVLLLGILDGSSHPIIEVARNAYLVSGAHNTSRTYTSLPLTAISNYLSSGLTAWYGAITLTGSETVKNALAFRITIPGTAASVGTTKIYYGKFTCITDSDTGIEEGDIEPYVNPIELEGEENWCETDLETFNRLEAGERVRTLTESGSDNDSPHYDLWIDSYLRLNFKQRRGVDREKVYSFDEENLTRIGHEYYGKEIAFQTIAYGAGSGIAKNRIISKRPYDAGGLYDAELDPAASAQVYGRLPRILNFVDGNETSAVSLLRKARAFHKLHRRPIENFTVAIRAEHIRYFETGDSIRVQNLKTRSDAALRVLYLKRNWYGDRRESITVKLGQPNPSGLLASIRETSTEVDVNNTKPQPDLISAGLAGNGVYGDINDYAVYAFSILNGASISRLYARITLVPYTVKATTGVTTFKGNTPGASPLYGLGVKFAVDATVDAAGVPTTFATQAHPWANGSAATPYSSDFDITDRLATEANGLIRDGEHKIHLLGAAAANNTNGLFEVQITLIVKTKETKV